MPLILYTARVLPTLKRGYSLVREWNSLPPEEQARLQEQGRRTVTAMMAVKVAITAARSAADPPGNWDEALDRALNGSPAEQMARAIVGHLQDVAETTADEIAAAVGAAGKEDSTFKRAMEMARGDGYIRRTGVTMRGIKWDTTEWADLQLLDSPHIRRIEASMLVFLGEVGVASIDHISSELGLEDDAPELLAALERAITAGGAVWYCNGVYGLPPKQLDGFEAARDLWAQTAPDEGDKDLGGALEELEAAVKGMAKAMKVEVRESSGNEIPESTAGGPYEDIRRLQELREAGVLTDAEFATKKAELLQRI